MNSVNLQAEPSSASPAFVPKPAAAEAASREAALRAAIRQGREAALACARGLRGKFAIGVNDAELRRTLLVVDRFATHTLCYRLQDGVLRFSASASDLVDGAGAIDPQAILDYLYFHVIPSPRTIYREVHRVPPGHALWAEGGRVELVPLWQPRLDAPAPAAAFGALRDEFLALLEQAVARRLDGSPAACFLSGGTDSSTVAGMIRRVTGGPAESYSIGFEAEGYDEMEYARLAARHFGTRHHEYYVTPADLLAGMPKVAAHHDQPFGNSSALPAYYCALRAREDGVSHMLAGDGGDELFGGNVRYAKQKVFDWYLGIPQPLRTAWLEPLSATGWAQKVPLLKKAASYVNQARVPMPDRMQTYNLLHRLGDGEIFAPGFLSQVDLGAPLAHEREVWAGHPADNLLNRMLAFDWRYTLAENDLVKVRGSTGLAGVDVSYPLLDDDLADFSLRLPVDLKLRGLKLRWFFKEALRGFLPDEIITKSKHGFGLPFGTWLCNDSGLQGLARDALASFDRRGVLATGFAERLLKVHLPAHPGFYGEMVWLIVMLELWLRAHAPDWRAGG